MKKYLYIYMTVICVILFGISTDVNSQTQTLITLQPGPTDGKDAMILSTSPNLGIGNDENMVVGDRISPFEIKKGLIQFELDTIPSNAVIDSVVLSFYNFMNYAMIGDTIQIYRIISPWEETEVSWNYRKTDTLWSSPGVDIDSTAYSQVVSINNSIIEFNITELVRIWANNTYENYGMLINSNPNTTIYSYLYNRTSDYSTPEQRPKLRVWYHLPEEIENFSVTDSSYTSFSFEMDISRNGFAPPDSIGIILDSDSTLLWTDTDTTGTGTITGLDDNTQYIVRAAYFVDDTIKAYSNADTVWTKMKEAALSNFSVTDSSYTSFTFEVDTTLTGFTNSDFDSIGVILDSDSTLLGAEADITGIISGLDDNTLYVVRAVYFIDDSIHAYSNTDTVWTKKKEIVLSNFTITDSSYNAFTFTVDTTLLGIGDSDFDSIKVILDSDSTVLGTFTETADTVTGLDDNTFYVIRAVSYYNDLISTYSNADTVWTKKDDVVLSNFTITDSSYNSFTFTVDTTLFGLTTSEFDSIGVILDSDSTRVGVFNDTTGTVTGLDDNTFYVVRAVYYEDDVILAYSNTADVWTKKDDVVLSNLAITDSSYNSFTFTVDTTLFGLTNSDFDSIGVILDSDSTRVGVFNDTTGTVTGLDDNSLYVVRAVYYEDDVILAYSNTANVWTKKDDVVLSNFTITDSSYNAFTFTVDTTLSGLTSSEFDSIGVILDSDSTQVGVFNDTTGTVTGLDDNTLYIVRAVYYEDDVILAYSNTADVWTKQDDVVLSNFAVTDSSYRSFSFTVDTTLFGFTSSEFDSIGIILDSDSTLLGAVQDTTGTVTGLDENTLYAVRAVYYEGDNIRAYSDVNTVWTKMNLINLSNFSITDTTLSGFLWEVDTTLTGVNVAAFDSINILSAADSSVIQTFTDTTGTVTGLSMNTKYNVLAAAYEGGIIRGYSNVDSVLTLYTGIVTGFVVDSANGNAMNNAQVVVTPGDYSGSTNSSGLYTIADIPPGTNYTLTVSRTNYFSKSITGIDITSEVAVDLDTTRLAVSDTLYVAIGIDLTHSSIERNLQFGISPTATQGIDTAYNEEELPPVPPANYSTFFDARFVQTVSPLTNSIGEGSLVDIRDCDDDTIYYFIDLNKGSTGNVTVEWDNIPDLGLDFTLVEKIGPLYGSSVNMMNQTTFTVTNPDVEMLQIIIGPTSLVNWNMDFETGWNLVSPGAEYADNTPSFVFPEMEGSAYTFNGTTMEYAGSLEPGKGYWVKFNSAVDTVRAGTAVDSLELNLQAGWNLIGSTSEPVAVNDINISTGSIISIYNNVTGVGYSQVTDSLRQGEGYWMNLSSDAVVSIYPQISMGKRSGSGYIDEPTAENSIYITADTDYGSRNLELNIGNFDNPEFLNMQNELPPAGPFVTMDVRFRLEQSGGLNKLYAPEDTPFDADIIITVPEDNRSTVLKWDNTGLKEGRYFLKDGVGGVLFSDVDMAVQTELDFGGKNINMLKFSYAGDVVIPGKYELKQNYPNPFNPNTTIKYSINDPGKVRLVIYNILGQEVRTLISETKPAGFYTVRWNASDNSGRRVAGGIYFYRLEVNGKTFTRKLLLLK